jgi:hypothetical protein
MSNQCRCATECEWRPEHYSLEHHPDCNANGLNLEQKIKVDLNLPLRDHGPTPVTFDDGPGHPCNYERHLGGAFGVIFPTETLELEQLIESNPDIITRAVVESLKRRTLAGCELRNLIATR